MNWLLPLIGGLGLGSLLKGLIDYNLMRRSVSDDRSYQEMREAYLGLLDALHKAAVHPSDEHAKSYALWQTRCALFGSKAVAEAAQEMIDTNDGPREARKAAHEKLIQAMRQDLYNS